MTLRGWHTDTQFPISHCIPIQSGRVKPIKNSSNYHNFGSNYIQPTYLRKRASFLKKMVRRFELRSNLSSKQRAPFLKKMVPGDRIELPTQRFSIACSTDWATRARAWWVDLVPPECRGFYENCTGLTSLVWSKGVKMSSPWSTRYSQSWSVRSGSSPVTVSLGPSSVSMR